MTAFTYLEQFINMVDVVEAIGGNIGLHEAVLTEVAIKDGIDLKIITNAQRDALSKTAKEKYLAMSFMLGADRTRYGRLIENMENAFLQGQDTYPKTINNAYNLIANWKQDPRNLMRAIGPAY